MTLRISNALSIAACNAMVSMANGGSIRFRTGAASSSADGESSGSILARLILPSPAFSPAVDANPGASAEIGAVDPTDAILAGTVGHFEFVSASGDVLWSGSITEPDGGGDMFINSLIIVADQSTRILNYTFLMPEMAS